MRPSARLAACCLASIALGAIVLPATAPAATTAQVSASFAGGKPGAGTSLHFGFTTSESAGGLPQLPTEAIIHLPKGTRIASLAGLPKADLCSSDTLEAADLGPSACPKGSHAGPVGSAHLEAMVAGHLTTAPAKLYPVVDKVGTISLWLSAPAPFPNMAAVLFPYVQGGSQELILRELGALEVSPGSRSAITDFSITLGANLKVERGGRSTTEPLITMPASCPKGGFAWDTDFTFWDASKQTTATTSPCPGVGASAQAHAMTARRAHTATAAPKTAFQCEKAFHGRQARERCFNQLPGVNCAHPLELQTAGPTHRGDTRDFTVKLEEERDGEGALLSYSWKPNKNVAICPNGAIFKVSLLYLTLPNGEIRAREHDTKNIPERTTKGGGQFMYVMPGQPVRSWYLVIRGYYIHPPWEHGG
jgi:hypothetical protein